MNRANVSFRRQFARHCARVTELGARGDAFEGLGRQLYPELDIWHTAGPVLRRWMRERVSPRSMPGGVDHGAERAGHIPSARHLDYRELLNDDHTFKRPAELLSALNARGIERSDQIIGYCRLSHRASLGWVALGDVANLDSVRVYDGSWTEWGSIVGVPIEA